MIHIAPYLAGQADNMELKAEVICKQQGVLQPGNEAPMSAVDSAAHAALYVSSKLPSRSTGTGKGSWPAQRGVLVGWQTRHVFTPEAPPCRPSLGQASSKWNKCHKGCLRTSIRTRACMSAAHIGCRHNVAHACNFGPRLTAHACGRPCTVFGTTKPLHMATLLPCNVDAGPIRPV